MPRCRLLTRQPRPEGLVAPEPLIQSQQGKMPWRRGWRVSNPESLTSHEKIKSVGGIKSTCYLISKYYGSDSMFTEWFATPHAIYLYSLAMTSYWSKEWTLQHATQHASEFPMRNTISMMLPTSFPDLFRLLYVKWKAMESNWYISWWAQNLKRLMTSYYIR